MNSKYEVNVKGLSGMTAPEIAKEQSKESMVRGYSKKGMREGANFRMVVTMTGLGERALGRMRTLDRMAEEARKKLSLRLDYSSFGGLRISETMGYLAAHNLEIGYKELMIDRLDRWQVDDYATIQAIVMDFLLQEGMGMRNKKWDEARYRKSMLDSTYRLGMNMGDTVYYVAEVYREEVGYKELMVDRLDRYMSEGSASEPSE